jgi:hypothetical protein
MKFKMQDKQNQLIERISDQHLVVGIDIAQQVHVARTLLIIVVLSLVIPSLSRMMKKDLKDYLIGSTNLKIQKD